MKKVYFALIIPTFYGSFMDEEHKEKNISLSVFENTKAKLIKEECIVNYMAIFK